MKVSAALGLAAFTIAAGPISKFDAQPPRGEYRTSKSPADVERCLIDMEGWLAPQVYQQADRPDQATLIWTKGNGISAGRVDLRREGNQTVVRSWLPAKQVEACAGK